MIPDDEDDLKLPPDPPEEEIDDGNEVEEEPDKDGEQTDGDADASGKDKNEDGKEAGEVNAKRGSKQFGELRSRAREEQLRADRLEREIADLRRSREEDRARATVETPEQENARLALMTPEERIDYKLAKAERANQAAIQRQNFTFYDQSDRLEYDRKATTDPRYSKYADEVEAKLAEARATGGNPKREVVLKFILGEKLLASAGKTDAQKKAAAAGIKRQTTSPMNGKGDQASAGRKPGSLAKRLENVQL